MSSQPHPYLVTSGLLAGAILTLISMAEVCFGVGSAALWAGQPFGALAAAAAEFGGTASTAPLSPRSASRA